MKKIYKINLILFVILLFFFNFVSKANSNLMLCEPEYSAEYKKWLELSDDDKKDTIMPPMYTINLDNVESSDYGLEIGASEDGLPVTYNTAESINLTVRDQGITNSCWAVTSTELFEILYAKNNNLKTATSFSERHMDYSCSNVFENNVVNKHGFNRTVGTGGRFEYAMAYYASGKGPILSSEMPFENNKDIINISEIQNKTVQSQLESYVEYPQIHKIYDEFNNVTYTNGETDADKIKVYTKEQINEFRNTIKKHILDYGALGTYTYYKESNSFFSEEDGYLYGNSYYCNDNSIVFNHAVCIVGWDDNYSKTNFKEGCQPANDGAYIALNSWGTKWNSGKGYYYISYDDLFVEKGMFGVKEISDVDYDNIYQYDEFGKNYYIGATNQNYIYGANVFYRNSNAREKLSEVGLYISSNKTNVDVYLNNSGNLNINNCELVASKDNLSPGYHVLKLDSPVLVGNTFSIIVKYENIYNKVYVPMEANYLSIGSNSLPKYNQAVSNKNESFISANGLNWNDLYNLELDTKLLKDTNVCIKAFTLSETESAKDTNYVLNEEWKIIKNTEQNMLYGIEEGTTVEELVSSGNFSNNYTVKIFKNNNEITSGTISTGTVIKIYNNSNLVKEYTIVIYGDTNLDGGIASIDALTIVKNKLGIESFKNEVCAEAGKVTSKTRTLNLVPSAVDALAVVKHKLKIEMISQY